MDCVSLWRRPRWLWVLIAGVSVLVSACAPRQPSVTSSVETLPGWTSDNLALWGEAFQRSCTKRPWQRASASLSPDEAEAWRAACASASAQPANADWRTWVETRFTLEPAPQDILATGYFEPEIRGSLTRSEAYPIPLYAPPPDLRPNAAYLSRAEIDAGALSGRGLEVAWLADAVDAFFLHIQGSGRIALPDGRSIRVGFAGHNARKYHAIGRDLIESGAIARSQISMQSIAAWLRAHPDAAPAAMQRNPRYIFFRVTSEGQGAGPIGAAGVPLTPQRSVAIDPTHYAYGLPLWLDIEAPQGAEHERLQRLVVAQDTGAAIKGAGRIDYFWGSGLAAGALAGRMRAEGRLYVLRPR